MSLSDVNEPRPFSTADMCNNCAFDDIGITFGTQLGHALRRIFGYRAIADLAFDRNGGLFSKWPPMSTIVLSFCPLDVNIMYPLAIHE